MSEVKTNAVRIVETMGAQYELFRYPCPQPLDAVTVAQKLGAEAREVYKTLVTRGKSNAYYVFVLPAERTLDLKKAARAAGEKAVEMIPVSEINRVTGYVRGGCSPVGMKKAYPTFIDDSARPLQAVYVSAGRLGQQMRLSPEALLAASGARYAELAAQDQEYGGETK